MRHNLIAAEKLNSPCKSCSSKGRSRIRPYEALYNTLVRQARVFKKPMALTFEEFLEFVKISACIYCDRPVFWAAYIDKGTPCAYNLDRKDNAQGYTKDNCVVCCKPCNYAKGKWFTHEEFVVMMTALKAFRNQSRGTTA